MIPSLARQAEDPVLLARGVLWPLVFVLSWSPGPPLAECFHVGTGIREAIGGLARKLALGSHLLPPRWMRKGAESVAQPLRSRKERKCPLSHPPISHLRGP